MSDVPMPPAVRKLAFDRLELTPAGHGQDGIRRQFAAPLAMFTILAGWSCSPRVPTSRT